MHEHDTEQDQPEEQRLGHRRGLQIQNVRIECEHRDGNGRRDARARDSEHQIRDRIAGEREGENRDRDGRGTCPIERIDLHGKQVEEMRQRQPDSPDL
jgi:hypothetical protein